MRHRTIVAVASTAAERERLNRVAALLGAKVRYLACPREVWRRVGPLVRGGGAVALVIAPRDAHGVPTCGLLQHVRIRAPAVGIVVSLTRGVHSAADLAALRCADGATFDGASGARGDAVLHAVLRSALCVALRRVACAGRKMGGKSQVT